MNQSDLSARLLRSIVARDSISNTISGIRLCDGAGDGLPGLYVDRFDKALLVHCLSVPPLILNQVIQANFWSTELLKTACVEKVFVRVHEKQASQTADVGAALVAGQGEAEFEITEGTLIFKVDLAKQVNAGLFLDMRLLRDRIQKNSKAARVLNLFCFTGSLGIAAYAGGASEVVQVDVSKAALQWAKQNLELNQSISQASMRFIPEDAGTYLRNEIRRGDRGAEKYQIVIIDPPSAGVSKKGRFSLTKDLPGLVQDAAKILAPGGVLVISANKRGLTALELRGLLEDGLAAAKRSIAQLDELTPEPLEFTSSNEDSIAMRGWWCRVL